MEIAVALEENVALSRHTTLGTGGPARWFARPCSLDELRRLLRWARERGLAVETVGLGSNLLVHDAGVDALVLKLGGELAEARVDGELLVAGGGAPHVAELLGQRKSTQPTNKRTFGSVFKNPSAERGAGRMLEECGLKGHRIGGAQISPRHANFIENAGDATSADALALMAEARRRAQDRFGVELEHEVRFLGPLELPPL